MALHAKSAALLEQANVYASNPDELEVYNQRPSEIKISRLNAVIDHFESHFPIVYRMNVEEEEEEAARGE
ncbi:hypothetical protein H2248_011189 [Termitomyces sp. 'cryptogamus']|nr:hypothetical protein H2248_011189 [Termitomyces sp. 'cryptogamus']